MGRAPHSLGANLLPVPDAQEYALLAKRLAHFRAPLIGLGVYDYPSRYSLAYPLLLAPFTWALHGDATRFFWVSALFGLAAVALMARAGRWLLGSPVAGGLAAAFFALHPQTIDSATVNMSETAILMMFFIMLELARPWIDCGTGVSPVISERDQANRDTNAANHGRAARATIQAALLGLSLAWLTLAKAPFAYWALAIGALLAARAFSRREWAPFVALLAAGLGTALADSLYRRWAFGAWGTNGYAYWAPNFYTEFLRTFNPVYLFTSTNKLWPVGNLVYYGRMGLGLSNPCRLIADPFYGRFMAPLALAGVVAMSLPLRLVKPRHSVMALMTGWAVVGFLFCGLYFYQEERFALFWIPLVDGAAAWALVSAASWRPARLQISPRWMQAAVLIVVLLLLRGEYRRTRDLIYNAGSRQERPVAETLRPLLERVPDGTWLLSNYNPPLVEMLRAHGGPVGSLYVRDLDSLWPLMNRHVFTIDTFGLKPKRARPDSARELQNLPKTWENNAAELIGPDEKWKLAPEERRAFFGRTVYVLIMRPASPPDIGRYLDGTILPLLNQSAKLEEIGKAGDATLYQARGRD